MSRVLPVIPGIAVIYLVLIGGTDAADQIWQLRFIGGCLGGGLILWWLMVGPRVADRTDRLVLVALLLFLFVAALAAFQRPALDASLTALAYLSGYGVLRGVLVERSARDRLLGMLGLLATVLSTLFLVWWGVIWIQWISVSGGPPPLDLVLPVGPFRHYHVVGTLLAILLPSTVWLLRRSAARPIGVIGTIASLAVIFMSGSRTVWLAIAIGALTWLVTTMRRRPFSRRVAGFALAAAGALGLMAIITGTAWPLIERLAVSSTVALRAEIWASAVRLWLDSPLTGWGPGGFGWAIGLTGYFNTYRSIGRHADSAPIQALAELGLIGILAIACLGIALYLGARAASSCVEVRAPLLGLAILIAASFTDNPTDSANIVAIGICYAALISPRNAAAAPPPQRRYRAISMSLLVIVSAAWVSMMAGAAAFEAARSAAVSGDSTGVVNNLRTAVNLDPGWSLYRRELGVWLAHAGDLASAEAALQSGVELNPSDIAALRALAMVQVTVDPESATQTASRAVGSMRSHVENHVLAAYIAQVGGEAEAQRLAMVEALKWAPWLSGAPGFVATFPDGDGSALLQAANADPEVHSYSETRFALASVWLRAISGQDDQAPIPALEVTGAVLRCELLEAEAMTAAMDPKTASTVEGIRARLLVAGFSQDERELEATRAQARLRYPPLGDLARQLAPGRATSFDPYEDFRMYGALALPPPPSAVILPTEDEGMSAWLVDPRAAAARGAPDSPAARCPTN